MSEPAASSSSTPMATSEASSTRIPSPREFLFEDLPRFAHLPSANEFYRQLRVKYRNLEREGERMEADNEKLRRYNRWMEDMSATLEEKFERAGLDHTAMSPRPLPRLEDDTEPTDHYSDNPLPSIERADAQVHPEPAPDATRVQLWDHIHLLQRQIMAPEREVRFYIQELRQELIQTAYRVKELEEEKRLANWTATESRRRRSPRPLPSSQPPSPSPWLSCSPLLLLTSPPHWPSSSSASYSPSSSSYSSSSSSFSSSSSSSSSPSSSPPPPTPPPIACTCQRRALNLQRARAAKAALNLNRVVAGAVVAPVRAAAGRTLAASRARRAVGRFTAGQRAMGA